MWFMGKYYWSHRKVKIGVVASKHSQTPITAEGRARTMAFIQGTFSVTQPIAVLRHATCKVAN